MLPGMRSLSDALPALHALTLEARETGDAGGYAQAVVDALDEHVGWENVAVLVCDQAARLEPLALSRPGPDPAELERDREFVRDRLVEPGLGVTGWVARHAETVRLEDVREDARYFPLREEIRAELCAPIRVAERTFGVLNTETSRLGGFTEADQRLAEVVSLGLAAVLATAPVDRVLTLCSTCKSYRAPDGSWQAVEDLLRAERGVRTSHGVCPTCRPYWEDPDEL